MPGEEEPVERDRLYQLDVVLTNSDDDQDRDDDAAMGVEDFCVMSADENGYGTALLLGQREPRMSNGKLPTADAFATVVWTARPANHTSPVGLLTAIAVPTAQACVGGGGGDAGAADDVGAADGTRHRVGRVAAMAAAATAAAAAAAAEAAGPGTAGACGVVVDRVYVEGPRLTLVQSLAT